MLPLWLVIGVSFAYLLILFAIAWWGDRRAAAGRSVIGNAWVYALSIAVYCTAWTYFGSVGRASEEGVWFLPIYLGPMLAMILAWLVIRKMVRIAKTWRITSVADFIASRYGKSPLIAALVTLITVVGIVPYIALQLKAISAGFALMTGPEATTVTEATGAWWQDSTFYLALALAGFIIAFGTRHLDMTERHEGMVAAIAFESVVKLIAFLAAGIFVVWGLYGGLGDLFGRAMADDSLKGLLRFDQGTSDFIYTQWFALILLAGLSVLFLPRQFQVMVVENVDERHIKRAAWVFPLYLFLINLFVIPIALGGLMYFGADTANPDFFVLSLPLAEGAKTLALFVFIGGLSAATGMVIVEAIAVSTMICNDLVMPALLRTRRFRGRSGGDLTRLLLTIRRLAIIGLLLLGYLYFHLAGEAYALVAIGLISFAAVAQFAPAALAGMYWKGGTAAGVLAGLVAGFALWAWTLMLPSIARSGWLAMDFVEHGPFGIGWLRPESLLGMSGFDHLTHSLFWSLLANIGAFVLVSLLTRPSAREASQAERFVDVFERADGHEPLFWQGRASREDLYALAERFLGPEATARLFEEHAAAIGVGEIEHIPADARLVERVEHQLAGAIGSASARVMMASTVDEEPLELDDVMRILEEASQIRQYSLALEEKSRSLEQATAELRAANEKLKSLDRLKDDFMSSVTHELRTPLTSIRATAEMMRDDADMPVNQRQQFLDIMVRESERLSRLVGQVLDLARIEAGHAEWHNSDVDMAEIVDQAVASITEPYSDKGAKLEVRGDRQPATIRADADRLVQVLLNLLSNALRHLPEANGQVIVTINDKRDGVTVTVADNGPGISHEEQAEVFDKFRQVGDRHRRQGGTGLGLPISRQIIEHFGGHMWVASEPGEGATFGFHLPRNIDRGDGEMDK
ncbi:histidine kinase [Wenzhouxiangella sp. AB-CW3]|uniref:sensor histidine kinase n=1 Tax=Wenzhouxiangella sp. AB-CW3 TaxID=2771012 RepID=UPI00168ADEEB|nr:sensor histidine kinase [Wenzhouxiangella sp. AB-CW3]QOC22128.1 histidine kinase [Wenzhouxiangella sp. AB-CW3]